MYISTHIYIIIIFNIYTHIYNDIYIYILIYLLVNIENRKKKDTRAHISHTELFTTKFESQYLKCKRASLPRMLPISHACLTVAFPVPTPEASLQAGRKYRSIHTSGEPESTTQFAATILHVVSQVALIPPDSHVLIARMLGFRQHLRGVTALNPMAHDACSKYTRHDWEWNRLLSINSNLPILK